MHAAGLEVLAGSKGNLTRKHKDGWNERLITDETSGFFRTFAQQINGAK